MYTKLTTLFVFIAACLVGRQGFAEPATNALPTGGVVNKGAASFSTSGATMTINQTTGVVDTSWTSFDIGRDAGVNIKQPSSASTFIGRIGGNNASQIFGSMNANGRVVLTNPRGVVFGPNSTINTGGLVASSKALKGYSADGNSLQFEGVGGSIINQGVIQGDFVALIGSQIKNEGNIIASTGDAALLASDAVEMTIGNSGRLTVEVNADESLGLIEQSGEISAKGGAAIIKADAAQSLLFDAMNGQSSTELVMRDGKLQLVNVGGTVSAKSVQIDAGEQGAAVVSAQVTAQDAEANTGGKIDVLGGSVKIASTATLDASGENGGGLIQVGGSWQNSNAEIPESLITTVEQGAQLLANATDQGDGGTIVVWSAVSNPASKTSAQGHFEANGGLLGGNGGRIETSGHILNTSGVSGSANAQLGNAGLWLFDPYNIIISDQGTTALVTGSYSSGGDSEIKASDIEVLLSGGTDVTITTDGAGGSIRVNSPIDLGGGVNQNDTSSDLTLIADDRIYINAPIAGTDEKYRGTVTLQADTEIVFDADILLFTGLDSQAWGSNTIEIRGKSLGTYPDVTINAGATLQAYSFDIDAKNFVLAGRILGGTTITTYDDASGNPFTIDTEQDFTIAKGGALIDRTQYWQVNDPASALYLNTGQSTGDLDITVGRNFQMLGQLSLTQLTVGADYDTSGRTLNLTVNNATAPVYFGTATTAAEKLDLYDLNLSTNEDLYLSVASSANAKHMPGIIGAFIQESEINAGAEKKVYLGNGLYSHYAIDFASPVEILNDTYLGARTFTFRKELNAGSSGVRFGMNSDSDNLYTGYINNPVITFKGDVTVSDGAVHFNDPLYAALQSVYQPPQPEYLFCARI
ncbi:filamentous hemagglutinin N-terminal domain-containing protein [Planktomarina temperata]|nr:filamentous hemagglutinin N-terminal domain-containing protein [Planktomarina temperata]